MAILKKMMDYLGLGPDDAYEDYDATSEPERPQRQQRSPRDHDAPQRQGRREPEHEADTAVRAVPTRPSFPQRDPESSARRPTPATDDSSVQPRPINGPRPSAAARPSNGATSGDPYTVKARRFDSAQELADKFKEGLPVIMNLEAADREVSRRLIDFASGLCYALDGSMEKVATGVYLLKPPSIRTA